MTRFRIVLTALVALLALAPSAAASDCALDLINDINDADGVLDKTYPIACYDAALKRLPSDAKQYNPEVFAAIEQARDKALHPDAPATTDSTATSSVDRGSTDGGAGAGSGTDGGSGTDQGGGVVPPIGSDGTSGGGTPTTAGATGTASAGQATSRGSHTDNGPLNRLIASGEPSRADQLPLPVIVLGVLALLLVSVGAAGFVAQRRSRDDLP